MPPCLFSQGDDMATKEQNLKRLDELALILGREPDISGECRRDSASGWQNGKRKCSHPAMMYRL
ncbi:DNA packaging protein from phage origin [Escherichia coli]|uniref:DNA packaging protein from phage origin n=1 Tax=Escherichia coli TaxID=562 RepID=A0A2X3K529_ECOLX|nr:DNA packaging protein from phage origin [Escherichia coli]